MACCVMVYMQHRRSECTRQAQPRFPVFHSRKQPIFVVHKLVSSHPRCHRLWQLVQRCLRSARLVLPQDRGLAHRIRRLCRFELRYARQRIGLRRPRRLLVCELVHACRPLILRRPLAARNWRRALSAVRARTSQMGQGSPSEGNGGPLTTQPINAVPVQKLGR